jgi:predicted dithiol-disulfide oxidoreductase (DUF899 family)
MSVKFPGETAKYRQARDALLAQEIELRRQMEGVAAARPDLPPGGEGRAFKSPRPRRPATCGGFVTLA